MARIRTNRFALVVLVGVAFSTLLAPAAQARGRAAPTLIVPPPASTPPPITISK